MAVEFGVLRRLSRMSSVVPVRASLGQSGMRSSRRQARSSSTRSAVMFSK